MIEHRLIERMVTLLSKEAGRMRSTGTMDPALIAIIADFMQTYADQCHHGKEEEILFKKLSTKQMKPADRMIMDRLIVEHRFARKGVKNLLDAKQSFQEGDPDAVAYAAENAEFLSKLYPEHIANEDKVFFPIAMTYLSVEEREEMLKQFAEFDQKLIHLKYKTVLESAERLASKSSVEEDDK